MSESEQFERLLQLASKPDAQDELQREVIKSIDDYSITRQQAIFLLKQANFTLSDIRDILVG